MPMQTQPIWQLAASSTTHDPSPEEHFVVVAAVLSRVHFAVAGSSMVQFVAVAGSSLVHFAAKSMVQFAVSLRV